MSKTKAVNRLKGFALNIGSIVVKLSIELTVVCSERLSSLNPVIYVFEVSVIDRNKSLIISVIMGNKISCCKANTPQTHRKKHESNNYIEADLKTDRIGTNLQHISEREPDDNEADPSSHPTAGPLFMQRSRSDIRCKSSLMSYRSASPD